MTFCENPRADPVHRDHYRTAHNLPLCGAEGLAGHARGSSWRVPQRALFALTALLYPPSRTQENGVALFQSCQRNVP
jgi:hypothetical protein